jgi:periplasmic protein TonB
MSELGTLSQCMLESDAASLSAGRVLRRKALTLSIALEAAILAVLVLGPILYPGVLPNILSRTPVPPYHRNAYVEAFTPNAPHSQSSPASTTHNAVSLITQQPPRIPDHVFEGAMPDAPSVAIGPGDGITGATNADRGGIPDSIGNGVAPPDIKPPAEKRPARLSVSSGVMEAALINNVQPLYPAPARLMRLSGDVELHAVIGADGSVRQLQVVSGNPILAQAALAAVRQWRYRPTLLSGQPVEVDTTITVKFTLGAN